MLKVKKAVSSKISTAEIDEWENDIKNSIKSLYMKNKNDSKLIDQYENALQTLKQEYTLVYKENEELKKAIEEMKSQQKISLSENQRKRPLSRFDYENEYNENENVQYIVRKKRKIPKKIIYEEEETDSENDEIDGETKVIDRVEETIEKKKRIKKPNKKGISKSIKMKKYHLFFIHD